MSHHTDIGSNTHVGLGPVRQKLEVDVRLQETGRKPSSPQDRVACWAVLGVVVLLAGTYVGLLLRNGWVPADEGILGQSALRVLNGQLPHRDFTEIYTGGLSMLHAVAFRVFGVNLVSMRYCVFLFFLAWLPAVYFVALRFTSAPSAGLITLATVSWSFPNYPAAMPSWYNLFFATFGAAASLRYLEVRKWRWLFLAGVCGGVSVLIKVIGLYYIAGMLLFLLFLEQSDEVAPETSGQNIAGSKAMPYKTFRNSSLLLFLATVVYFFHKRLGPGEIYEFVLPAATLVTLVLLYERQIQSAGSSARFRKLLALIFPFVAGLVVPGVLFLLPYVLSGTTGRLLSGIVASVASRSVGLGVIRPLGIDKAAFALALVALVAGAIYLREFQGKVIGACIGLSLGVLLLSKSQFVVSGVWSSAALLTPLVVLTGLVSVLVQSRNGLPTILQQQRIVLLISLAGLCSFVQYPFAAPIYLCYSLPLTLLAAVAIVATAKRHSGTLVLASAVGFYFLFGVFTLVPDYIYELTHKVGPLKELRLERARGLRVEFAPEVEAFVGFLHQHSPNGLLYAGNDCPEFYFLTGLRNITRDDDTADVGEVLKALQSSDVKIVVINEGPYFPGARMSPEVRSAIMRTFPQSQLFGIFRVFWRP